MREGKKDENIVYRTFFHIARASRLSEKKKTSVNESIFSFFSLQEKSRHA